MQRNEVQADSSGEGLGSSVTDYCESGQFLDDAIDAVTVGLGVTAAEFEASVPIPGKCEVRGSVDGVGGLMLRLNGTGSGVTVAEVYDEVVAAFGRMGVTMIASELDEDSYFVAADVGDGAASSDAAEFGFEQGEVVVRGNVGVLKRSPQSAAQAEAIGRALLAVLLGEQLSPPSQAGDETAGDRPPIHATSEFVDGCVFGEVDGSLDKNSIGVLESADGLRYCVGPTTIVAVSGAESGQIDGVGPVIYPLLAPGADGIDLFNELAAACFAADPGICPTQRAAIVIDDLVISSPTIHVPAFERDQITISGDLDQEEAERLTSVLQSQQFLELRPVLADLGPEIASD